MSFRAVFIGVTVAFALILAAFLINRHRPPAETDQPTADFVRASGKCAECHARLQYAVVHEYEMSAHATKGVNCLDCHQPQPNQQKEDHHGFVIAKHLTAGNCRGCHEAIYQEFLPQPPRRALVGCYLWREGPARRRGELFRDVSARRHKAPAASVCASRGRLRHDQRMRAVPRRRQAERRRHHRHLHRLPLAPHQLGRAGAPAFHLRAMPHGPRPLADRNLRGIEAWRDVRRAGTPAQSQCRRPRPSPRATCSCPPAPRATCRGINGLKVTHDPSERLSYYLANPITQKRPNYVQAQVNMKQVCTQCHSQGTRRPRLCAGRAGGRRPPTPRCSMRRTSSTPSVRTAASPASPSPIPSTSSTSTCGITTGAHRNTAPSWAARISCSGMATIPCMQKTIQLEHDAAELRREHGHK